MNEKAYKQLLKQTIRTFDRGKPEGWKNKDFQDLSFSIHLRTKILVSPATLKRIFGKVQTGERYMPQDATISALMGFCGISEDDHQMPDIKMLKQRLLLKWSNLVYLGSFIIIIFAAVFYFADYFEDDTTAEKANLELIKVEGNSPTTAYFKYQLPELSDSVFIDYGDDFDLVPLSSPSGMISRYYRFPGVFNVSLRTRNEVISDTIRILIPSDGFEVLAGYFGQSYHERFYPLSLDKIIQKGILHVPMKEYSNSGMDTIRILQTRVDNYTRTSIGGDNFESKFRIRGTVFWPAIRCNSYEIKIAGDKGDFTFKFVAPGCSKWGFYRISEKYVTADTTDLSMFSVNTNDWATIEILNRNKQVEVSFSDSLIFSDTYQQTIGTICGMTILFYGSGYVDYVWIGTEEEVEMFGRDF